MEEDKRELVERVGEGDGDVAAPAARPEPAACDALDEGAEGERPDAGREPEPETPAPEPAAEPEPEPAPEPEPEPGAIALARTGGGARPRRPSLAGPVLAGAGFCAAVALAVAVCLQPAPYATGKGSLYSDFASLGHYESVDGDLRYSDPDAGQWFDFQDDVRIVATEGLAGANVYVGPDGSFVPEGTVYEAYEEAQQAAGGASGSEGSEGSDGDSGGGAAENASDPLEEFYSAYQARVMFYIDDDAVLGGAQVSVGDRILLAGNIQTAYVVERAERFGTVTRVVCELVDLTQEAADGQRTVGEEQYFTAYDYDVFNFEPGPDYGD